MFEWLSNAVDAVVDFFTGGQDDDDVEPDPCDVGNCLQAKADLATARGTVQNACHWLGIAVTTYKVPAWVVSQSLPIIALVVIVAFLVGGPIGVVIVGAVYIVSILFMRAWLPVIRQAVQNYTAAATEEATAITEVMNECPADCQGDTAASTCVHLDGQASLPSTRFDRFLGRG